MVFLCKNLAAISGLAWKVAALVYETMKKKSHWYQLGNRCS